MSCADISGLVLDLTTTSMLQERKVGKAGWGGNGLSWFTLSPHKAGNIHFFGTGKVRQSRGSGQLESLTGGWPYLPNKNTECPFTLKF